WTPYGQAPWPRRPSSASSLRPPLRPQARAQGTSFLPRCDSYTVRSVEVGGGLHRRLRLLLPLLGVGDDRLADRRVRDRTPHPRRVRAGLLRGRLGQGDDGGVADDGLQVAGEDGLLDPLALGDLRGAGRERGLVLEDGHVSEDGVLRAVGGGALALEGVDLQQDGDRVDVVLRLEPAAALDRDVDEVESHCVRSPLFGAHSGSYR